MKLNMCADGFPRPSLAADVVLFALKENKLHLLLIERGQPPYKGGWALPGGFVKEYEPISACAERELREETGVELSLLEQFGIFDEKGRDPRGWYISVAFFGITPSMNVRLRAGSDATKAQWFSVTDLPLKLAFDHDKIVRAAVGELRARADRFDQTILWPVFAMLPETFTLSQMQEAFDALQGGLQIDNEPKASDKRNFRKKVLALVEEVSDQKLRGNHRPAQLYRPRVDIVGPPEEGKEIGRTKKELAERHDERQAWWTQLLALPEAKLHAHLTPGYANWISLSSGVRGVNFNYIVTQAGSVAELYIDRGKDSDEANKAIFDQLEAKKREVEETFGDKLDWDRMDNQRASRIRSHVSGGYRTPADEWPRVQTNLVNSMNRLHAALYPYIRQLRVGV